MKPNSIQTANSAWFRQFVFWIWSLLFDWIHFGFISWIKLFTLHSFQPNQLVTHKLNYIQYSLLLFLAWWIKLKLVIIHSKFKFNFPKLRLISFKVWWNQQKANWEMKLRLNKQAIEWAAQTAREEWANLKWSWRLSDQLKAEIDWRQINDLLAWAIRHPNSKPQINHELN